MTRTKILRPYQMRYKLLKMLMAEGIIDEPHCLAAVVDRIAIEYEKDYLRCVETCYDLEQDTERFVRGREYEKTSNIHTIYKEARRGLRNN